MALHSQVLDFGLLEMSNATHMCIVELEPTAYSLASIGAANCLGYKADAGNIFGAPSDHSVNGRCVASAAITNGTLVTTGTAAWWCAIDSVNARALSYGSVSPAHATTAGELFAMNSVSVRIPSQ
jgi:hypothetical protein